MTDFRVFGVIFNPNNAGQLGIVNACVVFEQWRSVTFGWVVVSSWTKSRFGSEPNRWAPVACETGLSNALDMLPHRFYRLGQRVDNFFIPALDSRGRLGEV